MTTLNGQFIPYPNFVGRQLLRLPVLFHRLGLGEVVNAGRILILTTQGRNTGLARHAPIEYRQHGSKIYVVSAWGERPNWLQNLRANPHVTVQRGRKSFSARANIVTNSGEALRVLHLFRRANPMVYDAILKRMSEREDLDPRTLPEITDQIIIVRLTPEPGAPELAPVPVNLSWILPVGLLASGVFMAVTLALTRGKRGFNG